jgi:hypothetical protein
MKNWLIFLLSVTFISCGSIKNSGEKNLSDFDAFPLKVPEKNSLMAKWEKKAVFESRVIDDMETDAGWKVTGIGSMSYTNDRSKDGKRSLRFSTSLRDEEHYRKNRSQWNSFNGGQGGVSSILMQYKTPQDWSAFNRISFWVYVHPSTVPTHCLYLHFENEGTDYNATTPRKDHFIQDLKPGIWNHVLFEIPHIERNKITLFEINQTLIGHTPDVDSTVTYDIDRLELQKVEADQYEGWSVAPQKFSYSQAGYRPGDPKVALAGDGGADTFQLIDQADKVVYSGEVRQVDNKNGLFHQLSFSDFRIAGTYRIKCGPIVSDPFPIDENIWLQPVFKAMNFFFCERCGYPVPGIHSECHKDWQGFHGDVKKIINGGWHDAGDLSQGSWRTSMAVMAMMNNLEYLQERKDVTQLADRIRDEITWGLEWLLKTRFGDGYHMSFSVMRIYTDNKVGTIDDVVTPAQNVPWENFLAAAVECKASRMLEKTNPELAGKAIIAAKEDWQAAIASREKWDQADYREASWGVTSSLLLADITSDNKYKEQALLFGKLLVNCQEQKFIEGIPVTGYFYENTNKDKVIHNYHVAFEEAPMIALTMLCKSFPDDKDWINWYSAVVLYSEYFMKRGSQIAPPYALLPNSVWKESEILAVKDSSVRKDMLRQFNDGTRLNKEYVLRTFPIYHDNLFHGNTNIQMSGTWALAEASRLRGDSAGMQLVGKQLQWVMGANPFGQSLMYGVGYDFAPQFTYCLKNIVGSLPVGMDCMSNDMPHWCATNTATSKEIWVEPVNRFLGAVSVYGNYNQSSAQGAENTKKVLIKTETSQPEKGIVTINITFSGTGKHDIDIKSFNSSVKIDNRQIDLSVNSPAIIKVMLQVTDKEKPYVAVITLDQDPGSRKEIVGSYNNDLSSL